MISSYMEGPLVQDAIRSVIPAVNHTLVMEGPAGPDITGCPESDFGEPRSWRGEVTLRSGRWRTDGRKRQAMLEWAHAWHKRTHPGTPLWGVIVDADEVLVNGEHVRAWLQRLVWEEEVNGGEFLGKPLRIVELDGNVSWARARLMRLDRIKQYEVSTSVFRNHYGHRMGEGNVPDSYEDWATPRLPYFEQGVMLQHPPISCEPHLVHRSGLRHPLRSGARMHEQEAHEIERVKAQDVVA